MISEVVINILNATINNYSIEQRMELYKKIFYIDYIYYSEYSKDYFAQCFGNMNNYDVLNFYNFNYHDTTYYMNIVNYDDLKILLNVDVVLNDILTYNYLGLRTLEVLMSISIDKDIEMKYLKILCKIINKLVEDNYIPYLYFDTMIEKINKSTLKLFMKNYDILFPLLETNKISLKIVLANMTCGWLTDTIINNTMEQKFKDLFFNKYLDEYIEIQINDTIDACVRELEFNNVIELFKKYDDLISTINARSLEILISYVVTLKNGFNDGSNKTSNVKYQLLLNFLFSKTKSSIIMYICDKIYAIHPYLKMKDILSFKKNKDFFIGNFEKMDQNVLIHMCTSKGTSVAKYCVKELIDNFLNFNIFYNNKSYCANFVILLEITLNTICDMISSDLISKNTLKHVLSEIIKIHPEISNKFTLIFIDSLDLYNFIEDSTLSSIGLNLLKSYLENGLDSKLEIYPVDVVTKIIGKNIEFVDNITLITILNNLYIENKLSHTEIKKLNEFIISQKEYIDHFHDLDCISKLIIKMITQKKYCLEFLEYYLKIFPKIKANILIIIFSKMYLQIKIKSLSNDNHKIEKIVNKNQVFKKGFDMIFDQNKTEDKQTILIKLTELMLDSDDNLIQNNLIVDVGVIEELLNIKDYTNLFADKHTCKICFDNENQVVLSCGHILCNKCCVEIFDMKNRCPFCQKHNVNKIKIYY